MVTRLENDIFDIMVEPSDWRYSAAIVGLSRYFEDRDKIDRKSTRLNSSHKHRSRMPSSA